MIGDVHGLTADDSDVSVCLNLYLYFYSC